MHVNNVKLFRTTPTASTAPNVIVPVIYNNSETL